jgi:hypothetical protein
MLRQVEKHGKQPATLSDKIHGYKKGTEAHGVAKNDRPDGSPEQSTQRRQGWSFGQTVRIGNAIHWTNIRYRKPVRKRMGCKDLKNLVRKSKLY